MYHGNNEAREKFYFVLEWLLAVTRRYPGPLRFGLAHISYEDPKRLGEVYGAKEASLRREEVMESLRSALRKTDLVSREGIDFWIIVPFTDEKISDKIKYILESASLAGLGIVERDISFFLLPLTDIPLSEDVTPAELLAFLKENRSVLSHRDVTLPASTS